MVSKVTDTQVVTATGVYDPASLTKWPEAGGTWSASLDTGTAVVRLLAWNFSMSSTPEIIATFSLPVPSGDKAGDMFDTQPVAATYDDWKWDVTSLTGGGNLRLSAVGVAL